MGGYNISVVLYFCYLLLLWSYLFIFLLWKMINKRGSLDTTDTSKVFRSVIFVYPHSNMFWDNDLSSLWYKASNMIFVTRVKNYILWPYIVIYIISNVLNGASMGVILQKQNIFKLITVIYKCPDNSATREARHSTWLE